MGGEIAIIKTKAAQALAQQAKMPCLVIGNRHPVGVKRVRHATEAIHRVPGQVDRVELDMGNRMHERRPALGTAEAALRQIACGNQVRPLGPAGLHQRRHWRIVPAQAELAGTKGLRAGGGERALLFRVGLQQTIACGAEQVVCQLHSNGLAPNLFGGIRA